MQKISLIISTAALSLQNAGARAATDDLGLWAATPQPAQPAQIAVLALAAMAVLLVLTRLPAQLPRWAWPGLPAMRPSQPAALALMAMIALSGSFGMA